MIKKMFLAFVLCVALVRVSTAQTSSEATPIFLDVHYVDPTNQNGHTRASAHIPLFYIKANVLSFHSYDDDFEIELWKNGSILHSQTVEAGMEYVELPTFLNGTFSLIIKFENIAYIGNIKL